MGNKMLIDATHPEETRVVVLRGSRVEEFDYESASKKQLRGNIYLAKVTRVEPSLQAAFVNYGGNRHGFLAFNEIHPDYYQLPFAERQALKQEEEQDSRADAQGQGDEYGRAASAHGEPDEKPGASGADADAAGSFRADVGSGHVSFGQSNGDEQADDELDPKMQVAALEAALPPTRYAPISDNEAASDEDGFSSFMDVVEPASDTELRSKDEEDEEDAEASFSPSPQTSRERRGHDNGNGDHGELDHVESVGSEDALEELPQRTRRRRRIYKIQEVIKRGQIMLVQVVKEERGNKGAALTTYLSLAGRYTVLMPNTASGGGISRKISSPADRKRLREIAAELDVPQGMGLIIRTAGAARTKTEIKRDYEYLLRLWENVRDLTLHSTAPCLVYEEGDLIKRSIRDLYNKEIDEILVAGDDAYREAKDFMRMLMPSHAKNVQPYKEPEPVFTRYEVERQLNAMFSPQVTLPSGGYIIINQTEALVAVDVNSGKATREYSIEDTALKTNLEAAEEIARQLRLRDLAGLIVVDFIDMEEKRNNRSVERRLKECLRNDRARIQVGRISPFGLLEMSRQRLRTGMIEGSTSPCQHCQGTGVVRSTESVALSVLRSLEDWLRTNTPCNLAAVVATDVALYILNQKRSYLRDIESRHQVTITISASDRMHGANFYIEKVAAAAAPASSLPAAITQDRVIQPFESDSGEAAGDQNRRSRRRRRRRRGRGDEGGLRDAAHRGDEADEIETVGGADETEDDLRPQEAHAEREDGSAGALARRRSRRRGRRGGRRRGQGDEAARQDLVSPAQSEEAAASQAPDALDIAAAPDGEPAEIAPAAHTDQPEERRAQPHDSPEEEAAQSPGASTFRNENEPAGRGSNGAGKANGHARAESSAPFDEQSVKVGEQALAEIAADEEEKTPVIPPAPKPRGTKRGWWQRKEQ